MTQKQTPQWTNPTDALTFHGTDGVESFVPLLREVADYLESTKIEDRNDTWLADMTLRNDEYGRRITLYFQRHKR